MVVALIILNIILIFLLAILVLYVIKYNKCGVKGICITDDKFDKHEKKESVVVNNNQKNNLTQERVFIGRFVTEGEYQKMMKNRKSDISVLIEELHNEYEHLKELSK
jgi:hypothetical protein